MITTSTRTIRRSVAWIRLTTLLVALAVLAAFGPGRAEAKTAAKASSSSKAKPPAAKATTKKKTTAKATAKKKAAKKTAAKKKPTSKKKAKKTATRKTDKGTTKVCKSVTTGKGKRKKTKRSCKRVKTFQGHGVARAQLRTAPLEQPSGELAVWSENLGEGVTVNIYAKDAQGRPTGEFDDAALAALDEVFRCRRTQEVRAVDPKLYEQLSRMLDHFRSQEGGEDRRFELVSGLRYSERNSSRHHHASAADVRIKGVSIREMYDYAESLDPGGMGIGIYPTSGFIHFDYRAPGEPSYRWTDLSGPGSGKASKSTKKKKAPAKRPRTTPARRATS
ncbi:MAG: DUF882 domain-containing protein [Kofleriaceae bacterium]